jgi:hypothetical protein
VVLFFVLLVWSGFWCFCPFTRHSARGRNFGREGVKLTKRCSMGLYQARFPCVLFPGAGKAANLNYFAPGPALGAPLNSDPPVSKDNSTLHTGAVLFAPTPALWRASSSYRPVRAMAFRKCSKCCQLFRAFRVRALFVRGVIHPYF